MNTKSKLSSPFFKIIFSNAYTEMKNKELKNDSFKQMALKSYKPYYCFLKVENYGVSV